MIEQPPPPRLRDSTHQSAWTAKKAGRISFALANFVLQAIRNRFNQRPADTLALRDPYKMHHWQVRGPMCEKFHLLFVEARAPVHPPVFAPVSDDHDARNSNRSSMVTSPDSLTSA